MLLGVCLECRKALFFIVLCRFIIKYVLPQTDAEKEYLERFSWGSLDLGLLFEDEAMARAATASPETQWKLQNIRKMQEMGALRFQDYQAQALQSTLATCR